MNEPALALPLAPTVAQRLSGRPLMLLLDIDGTLSPIAPRPEYAVVPEETRQLLRDLAATPDVHVVVVTGRSAEDGRRVVGVDEAWVIGNHGIEVAPPNRTASASEDVAHYETSIAEAAKRAEKLAERSDRNGVVVENKRWTLSVHYRLAHPQVVPHLRADVQQIADELGLKVTTGKEVFELRPPADVDKGTAAVQLAKALSATHDHASLFAAGDDRTDEDMFRALRDSQPRAVTVRVGDPAETAAEFIVADTVAMRKLLAAVLELRRDMSD